MSFAAAANVITQTGTDANLSGLAGVTGGRVFTYNYGATTRYRFISTDNTIDAFYSNFNGSAVSGLIATKALNF